MRSTTINHAVDIAGLNKSIIAMFSLIKVRCSTNSTPASVGAGSGGAITLGGAALEGGALELGAGLVPELAGGCEDVPAVLAGPSLLPQPARIERPRTIQRVM